MDLYLSLLLSALAVAAGAFGVFHTMRSNRDMIRQRLLAWGDEVIDTLSEAAQHLQGCDKWESRDLRLLEMSRGKVSSLWDRGRWLFPNTETSFRASNMNPGFRPPVLDAMRLCYCLLRERESGIDPQSCRRTSDALVAVKRAFTAFIRDAATFHGSNDRMPIRPDVYERWIGQPSLFPSLDLWVLEIAKEHDPEIEFHVPELRFTNN
jgi:hypothetical protein